MIFNSCLRKSKELDDAGDGLTAETYRTFWFIVNGVFVVVLTVGVCSLLDTAIRAGFNFYLVWKCADKAPEIVQMILEAIVS